MNTHPDPAHPQRHDPQPTFPRIPLGLSPTPLHRLTGLMSAFDHGPELLAKREDLLGAGYGAPTPAGRNAAQLAARHDGLLLDHTYTAKAMAGLIQGIRDGTYTHHDRIVFFHTGGLAGFLAPRGHAGS
jgi:1-aminocyclopropane-1-carboxylate deaminase/D-cysteine desulfhydrase-like pyridoxal-dependent ACC family enzyme